MLPKDLFMQRAIELAKNGLGHVSPNPLVGCVIVREGNIIGEGWHHTYGGPHAEVNAVGNVKDKKDLSGSEVFVNLEPCAHHGKTPPCADLLIKSEVKRIYIANLDINPLVNGKGIKKLRNAGVEVIEGFHDKEGHVLNKRFFTYHIQKKPYIILKWAQTADGFIARENLDARWISNEYSRLMVHKWRSEEDAVMVGANTVLQDDSQLNVREWEGRNPVRMVIDPNLKIPRTKKIFDHSQTTIIYNYQKNVTEENLHFIKISHNNFLGKILLDLKYRGIQSLIVEGGAFLLTELVKLGLWNEARVFTSPKSFGRGLRAPLLSDSMLTDEFEVFDDRLSVFIKNGNSHKTH